MANEAADPVNIEMQTIVDAIAALKAKGWDINPFTVADEAKLRRALVYRNSEFMDLIIKERGSSVLVDEEEQDELRQRLKETENRVRQLQIQNEVLTLQQQQQYDIGHKLGIIEGRKLAQAEIAAQKESAQSESAKSDGVAAQAANADAIAASAAAQAASQEAPATVESPIAVAASSVAHDLASELSGSLSESDDFLATREEQEQTGGLEPLEEAARDEEEELGDWETPDISETDVELPRQPAAVAAVDLTEPMSVHYAELPPVEKGAPVGVEGEAGFSDSYSERVFNAARTGPFVASEFNPLIELSWKDLETVYHFRAKSLKDLSRHFQPGAPPQEAAAQPSTQADALDTTAPHPSINGDGEAQEAIPANGSSNMGETYSSAQITGEHQAYRESELLTLQAREEAMAQEQALAEEPGMAAQQAFAEEPGMAAQQAFAEEPGMAPQQAFAEEPGMAPQQAFAEEPGMANEPEALDENAYHEEHSSAAEKSQAVNSDDFANQTNDSMPAYDPETGELPPDLDALDIFDGLDDYANLEDIEIIQDVVLKEGRGKTSDDELRELIKNRIKQAREAIPEAPKEGGDAPAAKEGEPAKGMKSKFVGSKSSAKPGSEPQAAQTLGGRGPQVGAFASRNITPEIRKACLILGVRPEEMTIETVQEAWKRQIASPGVHPDLGGDTESAIYLNTAKDTLLRFLHEQAPKLGKKFGGGGKEPPKPGPRGHNPEK